MLMEVTRTRARDSALLHLVFNGGLDARSLGALCQANTLLRDAVRSAWKEQATIIVDWSVPVAGRQAQCGVLAQLRGALVVDSFNCYSVKSGTLVQLPQAASIRSLTCLDGVYRLPLTFAAWPRLEAITWRAPSVSLLDDMAALVELFSTAPALQTLTIEAHLKPDGADLLGSLLRLCDKPSVTCVMFIKITDYKVTDYDGFRIPVSNVLHKCSAWEGLAAAHGLAGSNKLLLHGLLMTLRGHHADWFKGAVATAHGAELKWGVEVDDGEIVDDEDVEEDVAEDDEEEYEDGYDDEEEDEEEDEVNALVARLVGYKRARA